MEIDISVVKEGPVSIIHCAGQIETSTYLELKKTIMEVIKSGVFNIVIDLSKADFMSSAGWSAVLGHLKEARQGGGDIILASLSEEAKSGYYMANFDEIIRSYDTVEKAIEAFKHSGK